MKRRKIPIWHLLLLFFMLVVGLVRPVVSASAADDTVSVWLTTADGDNRLTRQSDLSFASDGPYNPLTIHVDENRTYQQMDGFGASLTDTSAWLLYNSPISTTIMTRLFDPVQGIGISFLRQPMGASDFTKDATPYSYDDVAAGQTDPSLAHFSIAHDSAYIIPMLRKALQLNPALKIMATPWSPPGWMKTSGSMIQGSLTSNAYASLANYFVKYIDDYQAQGIPIYALSPQNEPGVTFSDYPGMALAASDESRFITDYLGPAFNAAHLSPKLFAYDHVWNNGDPADYPFTVMNSANAYLTGTAYHCYRGDPDAMTQMHDAYPQKDVYETECSGGLARGPAIELVINSARNWAKSALLWNVALDPNGGPRLGTGCNGCTGLATIDPSAGTVSYTDDYYQLGQASKFVVPGAYRIDSNTFGSGTYNSGTIEDVAFKNPDGSKALIVYNSAPSIKTFKVRWGSKSFTYTLPARATATFTWAGVQDTGTGTPPPGPIYYAVDAGGPGAGRFMPDSYFSDGQSSSSTDTIDTNLANNPAPAGVYQSQRSSPTSFSYTFPDLTPGAPYGIRLHFAELDYNASGKREFNISINGTRVLSNFDIYAAAGGQDKAIVSDFVTTADNEGQITIQYAPGAAGFPTAGGIEVIAPSALGSTSTPTPPFPPTSTLPPTAIPFPSTTETSTPTSANSPTATPTPTSTNSPTTTPTPTPTDRSTTTPTPTDRSTTAPTGTSVPAAPVTNTPVHFLAATMSSIPTPTVQAVDTKTPKAVLPSTRKKAGPRSTPLPLTVHVMPASVQFHGYLVITVRTTTKAHIDVTLQVSKTWMRYVGHGAHRRRETHSVVLYKLVRHGIAGKGGRFGATLQITYLAPATVRAHILIVARTAHNKAVRSAWVTILPPRHVSKRRSQQYHLRDHKRVAL